MKKRPTDPTKIIDEIQVSLSETRLELRAYSTLFESLGSATVRADDIIGLKCIFIRVIASIDDTNKKLNEIYPSISK